MYGGGYTARRNGDLEYRGERPGADWHVHGWTERQLLLFEGAKLRLRRLHKRRWLQPAERRTQHSRPPDEIGALQFCGVVIAVTLWGWLDGAAGVHSSTSVVADLRDGRPSSRTAQRWLHRAVPFADEIQQRIRRALIERCEPRPVEHLFPRGLSPPGGLTQRHWQAPLQVAHLWRALTMLFVGAVELHLPAAALLAEARGR